MGTDQHAVLPDGLRVSYREAGAYTRLLAWMIDAALMTALEEDFTHRQENMELVAKHPDKFVALVDAKEYEDRGEAVPAEVADELQVLPVEADLLEELERLARIEQQGGLRPGDRWCLCASRFLQAHEEGLAPKVHLGATHRRVESDTVLDTEASGELLELMLREVADAHVLRLEPFARHHGLRSGQHLDER